jgi:hypothetical protein
MSDKVDKIVRLAVKLIDTAGGTDESNLALTKLAEAVHEANLLPGEPIFCLRGKDSVAGSILNYWWIKAEEHGASKETVKRVQDLAKAFWVWQQDPKNAQHVKVPT